MCMYLMGNYCYQIYISILRINPTNLCSIVWLVRCRSWYQQLLLFKILLLFLYTTEACIWQIFTINHWNIVRMWAQNENYFQFLVHGNILRKRNFDIHCKSSVYRPDILKGYRKRWANLNCFAFCEHCFCVIDFIIASISNWCDLSVSKISKYIIFKSYNE